MVHKLVSCLGKYPFVDIANVNMLLVGSWEQWPLIEFVIVLFGRLSG